MRVVFVETTGFTAAVGDYFGSDAELAALQNALCAEPERGAEINGCGGLRKVRWRDTRRGKGKRGGLRIIYLWVPEASSILLLHVYDKDEADDLTASERRELARLAEQYRRELNRPLR